MEILYSEACVIAHHINGICNNNAISTAKIGYKETKDVEMFDEFGSRGVPLSAPATIICKLKATVGESDPRCVFFAGSCPEGFTKQQL